MRRIVFALAILTFLLTSCKKDMANDDGSMDSPGSKQSMAVLAIFNAIPNATETSVLLDNELFNRTNEILRFGDIIRHRIIFSGKRRIQLQVRNTNGMQSTVTNDLTFQAGKNYSIFLYGVNSGDLTVVEDNLILPPKGKFKVRFANFGFGAGAINVGVMGDTDKFFKNVHPNMTSNFIELDVAEYNFFFSNVEQSFSFDASFRPKDQAVYTIWVQAGDKGPTSGSFGKERIQFVEHP